ncbi:MAG: hypothetical protein KJO08_10525, partial [Gammaproteobacteria bacterium]|nr:hypothetical protein [Gammaproteobacteria bacterium]
AAVRLLDEIEEEIETTGKILKSSLVEIRHYMEELNYLGKDTLDIFRVADNSVNQQRTERSQDNTSSKVILGNWLDTTTLGWRTLYDDTMFEMDLPEELAQRRIEILYNLDFRRALRVLLHNAFRHGREWVRIEARLKEQAGEDAKLTLTVTNGAYPDIANDMTRTFSQRERPSASPLIRASLGLVVARQLTTQSGGSLTELVFTDRDDEELCEAHISLTWPIKTEVTL